MTDRLAAARAAVQADPEDRAARIGLADLLFEAGGAGDALDRHENMATQQETVRAFIRAHYMWETAASTNVPSIRA